MVKEKWTRYGDKIEYDEIAREYNISNIMAKIIRNRGVEKNDIGKYLSSDLSLMYSPWLMKDMKKAVDIIKLKISEKKKIRVVGDYDIDGICSTYILVHGITHVGGNVSYDIPDRVKDGYGINENIIRKAYADGVDTIITCDNGIAAFEAIDLAKELGMTIVVTDHHEVLFEEISGEKKYLRVNADATVNPHQPDCTYPFKLLCGGGIAFKFIIGLYETYGIDIKQAYEFIEFAAIATIGDIVDLKDENRIIAKHGLAAIHKTKNIGLNALINACQLVKTNISAYHIGFVIGPCLNASGRLETAKLGYELLSCLDENQAMKMAENIRNLNESRKNITEQGVSLAVEMAEKYVNDKVLVIYLKDIHESVAGIIAGRIKEKYNKPTIVLTDTEETGVIKGSGRSIENYDMFENLNKVKDLFLKFGGHKMAAGLSLKAENLNIFREQINKECMLTDEDMVRKIVIDSVLNADRITFSLVNELKELEPFGKGNEKPVFAVSKAKVEKINIIGKNKNVVKLRLRDASGICIEGVIFNKTEEITEFIISKFGNDELQRAFVGKSNDIFMSCIFYPDINEYNGMKNIQIIVNNYC
ncbi:MAG: single-stranded-DNA-specific exonuclease RecJ [Lachnospiraceae bacterium]|nr:single-stranded-DNA-specific exonuclease RecJ [Lachnospiraceae bacterium]